MRSAGTWATAADRQHDRRRQALARAARCRGAAAARAAAASLLAQQRLAHGQSLVRGGASAAPAPRGPPADVGGFRRLRASTSSAGGIGLVCRDHAGPRARGAAPRGRSPPRRSFCSTASTDWPRDAAAAQAIAERRPEAQCASTGPSSSLSACSHAADHALREHLGLGDRDMPEAEAGFGGKLRFLRRSSGGPATRRPGRLETMDLKPSAAAAAKSPGCERAGDGKMRGDVDDPCSWHAAEAHRDGHG